MLRAWSQCSGCDSPVRAGDPTAARQWLGRFIGDEVMMARLRQLALSTAADTTPDRSDDQALTEGIAWAITSGAIRVCGPATALKLYALVAVKAAAATTMPPAPAAAAARAAPVSPAPPVETTFGPDLEVAAMVAGLVKAAQDGVPFCEECAKAAASRAAAGVRA